jgi:hypothetical membrane protein
MYWTLTTGTETSRPTARRATAWAGIVGPVLFTAVFVVLELVRGSEYDRVAETVSALEAGPYGWVQQVNFVVLGLLTIGFAVGLHRAVAPSRRGVAGPLLLGLSGVANILGAVFPVREGAAGATYAPTGHVVAGSMFFATSALALLVLSRRLGKDSRWSGLSRYAAVAGGTAVIGFVVMGALVIPDDAPLHEYAGLGQRLLILLVVFPCRVTLAARMLRLVRSEPPK